MVRQKKADRKKNLEFVTRLMKITGENYEEWLDEKHQEFIRDNQEVIFSALDSKVEQVEKKEEKKEEKFTQELVSTNQSNQGGNRQ